MRVYECNRGIFEGNVGKSLGVLLDEIILSDNTSALNKALCSHIRAVTDTTKLIALGTNTKGEAVTIHFDCEDDGKTYKVQKDEETGKYYFEIDEVEG